MRTQYRDWYQHKIAFVLIACLIQTYIPATAQEKFDNALLPASATPGSLIRNGLESKAKGTVPDSPLGIRMPEVEIPSPVSRLKSKADFGNREIQNSAELKQIAAQWPNLLIMAGVTFLPAALLMTTSFVRFQITLSLLRQALGSPGVPGNQVILAISLLLSVIVMRPIGEKVYRNSVKPYMDGRMDQAEAIQSGIGPLKKFMVDQIIYTGHLQYLSELAEYDTQLALTNSDSQSQKVVGNTVASLEQENLPIHVVAAAFLLSELTTALLLGFAVYLPFLIVDLVVATVLAAMGLWMMPPTLVSTPAKLILFVLADGWMLTAGALINGFAIT